MNGQRPGGFALLCSDVRRTIELYPGVLEFPLTEIFENRDYQGPTTSSSTSGTATCRVE